MNRRNFIKSMGLGIASLTVGITASKAAKPLGGTVTDRLIVDEPNIQELPRGNIYGLSRNIGTISVKSPQLAESPKLNRVVYTKT